MKQLTIKDIRDLEPCYAPTKYLPEDWTGTVVDILKMTNAPVDARLWIAVRSQFLSDKTLKSFALACARTAEKYSTDEIAKKCNDVTESYLKGEATKEDLDAAAIAPSSSSPAATFAVSASRAAADVAYSASRAAVYVSATYAAYAAYSAVFAATSASISPQEEQRLILIKLIEENEI